MGAGERRRALAFAPCHVTGVFFPVTNARDPRARGSLGAGLVLDVGVRALGELHPSSRARVRLTSDTGLRLDISGEAARRLVADRRVELAVHLTHELPIGQGFGTSAAGALATALAAGRLLGDSRRHAVEVAHLSDLFGGGGLGGVAALLGGGLEVRLRPGIPPFGHIVHEPFPDPVWVGVLGRPLPSPVILSQPRRLAQIRSAGEGLTRLGTHPSPEEFLALSERFTDRAGLASPEVRLALRALRRRGARAAQAMFGRSFFAVCPRRSVRSAVFEWLQDHGIRAAELRSARRGAYLRAASPPDHPRGERPPGDLGPAQGF